MKRQTKRKVKTAYFFNSPKIKKIMADPKRRASIKAKGEYIDFLETIARIRRQEGITQTQLSRITNIGQDELSRIERGQKNITFETFFRIVGGLGYEAEIKYHKTNGTHA